MDLTVEIHRILANAADSLRQVARAELKSVARSLERWLNEIAPKLPDDQLQRSLARLLDAWQREQVFVDDASRAALEAWVVARCQVSASDQARGTKPQPPEGKIVFSGGVITDGRRTPLDPQQSRPEPPPNGVWTRKDTDALLLDIGKRVDDFVNDPRWSELVATLKARLAFLQPEDIGGFLKGLGEGFVVDGFLETFVDVWNIVKYAAGLSGRLSVAALDYLPDSLRPKLLGRDFSWWYRLKYGEGPLDPEKKAALAVYGMVKPAVEAVAHHGPEVFHAIFTGDRKKLVAYSQLLADVADLTGDLFLEIAIELANVEPEEAGRFLGWLLFMFVGGLAKAGVKQAAKTGALCNVTRTLIQHERVKKYPRIVKILERFLQTTLALLNTRICFVAGTPVHTATGLRPIEAIRTGELVLSRDEHSPEAPNCYRRVLDVLVTHPAELLTIEFKTAVGEESITCTPTHPFYAVTRAQFVEANELCAGMGVALIDGPGAVVVSVSRSVNGGDPCQPTTCCRPRMTSRRKRSPTGIISTRRITWMPSALRFWGAIEIDLSRCWKPSVNSSGTKKSTTLCAD